MGGGMGCVRVLQVGGGWWNGGAEEVLGPPMGPGGKSVGVRGWPLEPGANSGRYRGRPRAPQTIRWVYWGIP